ARRHGISRSLLTNWRRAYREGWLADILARIADTPLGRLDELLPWNWRPTRQPAAIAA
ncbi:MAG: transposase, partial [Planctomycetes bacterium]|nr:transposase [Planctomycetota bacterium]